MAAPLAPRQQDPPRPARAGKKWIRATRVVEGQEVEEWVEVDAGEEGPTWGPREALRLLAHDLQRVDAPDKVDGRARYAHDVRAPGMVYARLLLCPYPAAKVTLDLEPARKLQGVAHVSAIEVPEGATRFLGQPLAAVAAPTPELAEDALRAIRVDYDLQPFALTREQALAPGAPQVTSRGNVRELRARGEEEAARKALEGCDAVVDATYTLPVQHHACLETHGLVVDYRGGGEATVHASTQGTFVVHDQVPGELGLDPGQVTVLVQHMGGGFGSKFGIGVEGQTACRIAKELKRPVHLLLTRADEFLMAGNRSGCVQRLQGGASRDGKLVALVAEVDQLGGLSEGSFGPMPYVYAAGASFTRRRAVYTNTDAARAFRAPGHPQASFGMESLMDELAYAIGMDLLEFRKRNLPEQDGDVWRRQLDRVAREIGWGEHPHRSAPDLRGGPVRTGIGFGVSVWGGGGSPVCEVDVRIARDGAVTVLSGTQDLGTGTRTYTAAIVAEELGLPLEAVSARIGSSEYGRANPSGGSTTAASLAPAVKHAAWNARRALLAQLADALGVEAAQLELRDGSLRAPGGKVLAWKEACGRLGPDGVSARGTWQSGLAGNGVHGAQAAKVQVDTRTGEVRVVKMVCVQDCGLPLNTLALKSQIQGGMVQALSYALFEERVVDPDLGVMLNAGFEDYKLAGCQEIPEMVAIVDEEDARQKVIGMAEPAVVPGQSAIANAVHNACGARIRGLPLTPDKVLMALEALRADAAGGGAGGAGR